MKKLLFLLSILIPIVLLTSNLYANVYQVDPNTIKWAVGPDPENQPDGQLWYTYNDWTWIEGSLALDSAWEGDPNTFPWPSTLVSQTYCLQIRSASTVDGSTITPTGYEFDLASAGITGKLISNIHIINAFWSFPGGVNAPVAPAFYDEDDNLVFRKDPTTLFPGWWQGEEIDFSNYPTKKVKFLIEPFNNTWIWSGNYVYLEQVTITLINEDEAKCGTKYHPYPDADLNGDCVVDFADIALLTDYWLKCNDPADANCTE